MDVQTPQSETAAPAAVETPAVETPVTETAEAQPEQQPQHTEQPVETEAEEQPAETDPLKKFASLEMDDEAQAQALIDIMGQQEEPKEGEQPGTPTVETGYYSPEELNATPLDAIDAARLPESAREYLPIVKQNMDVARRTIAALQQQNAMLVQQLQAANGVQTAQPQQQPVKPDFKALAAQAAKLAKERLGLSEDDELETAYEPEHAAAFHMAMREIADGQRNAEAQTQRTEQAWGEWNAQVAQYLTRPDAQARLKWVEERLAAKGKHLSDLDAYIRTTGDVEGGIRTLNTWDRMYDAGQTQQVQNAVKNQARPGQKPPVLESASGVDASGRRSMNLKSFGELETDPEAQARALQKLGIV